MNCAGTLLTRLVLQTPQQRELGVTVDRSTAPLQQHELQRAESLSAGECVLLIACSEPGDAVVTPGTWFD